MRVPPIFAVPSQRNAHHFQSSSLSEQVGNGERFRSLSEPRRQRAAGESGPTSFSKVCDRCHLTICKAHPGSGPDSVEPAAWEALMAPGRKLTL